MVQLGGRAGACGRAQEAQRPAVRPLRSRMNGALPGASWDEALQDGQHAGHSAVGEGEGRALSFRLKRKARRSGRLGSRSRAGAVTALVLLLLAAAAVRHAHAQPLDRQLRSIHLSGNGGANRYHAVERWDPDGTDPLIPLDFVEYLQGLYVDWVGLSVGLHYDDSMDSTVERVYSPDLNVPTFSDTALRQLIHELRGHGFNVYLTLSFEAHEALDAERPVGRYQLGDPGDPDTGVPNDDPAWAPLILPENWPWRPSHPDHRRFVREFWETYTAEAVHFARIAQEEGVRMYSLGTEVDRLFRTRKVGRHWTTDFRQELEAMVGSVRAEYDGLLTYDMHYSVITRDWFPWGKYLWEDLGLDVVGVSAWFPLAEMPPSSVTSVDTLQQEYERIFREHLVPLAAYNAGRPVVFTEYGAIDTVEGPAAPGGFPEVTDFIFSDMNGNGIDDGRETQANIFEALFRTMDRYPGVVYGAFFWDNWIASDEDWETYWSAWRNYDIRNKPSGEVVRAQYSRYANRPPAAVGTLPDRRLPTPGSMLDVDVSGAFVDPDGDVLTYVASSAAPQVATSRAAGARVTLTAVSAGVATIRVTATDPGGLSATQPFAVTVGAASFTDEPIRPGVTLVKAVHFTELRRRVDALRGEAGLGRFAWTDAVLTAGVTPVKVVHLLELRAALAAAYAVAGRAEPDWTDAGLVAGTTVKAVHLMELRAAVQELE